MDRKALTALGAALSSPTKFNGKSGREMEGSSSIDPPPAADASEGLMAETGPREGGSAAAGSCSSGDPPKPGVEASSAASTECVPEKGSTVPLALTDK